MKTILFALYLAGCAAAQAQEAYQLSRDFRGTHDPSIIRQGDTWYVFAAGKAPDGGQFAIRCSQDLKRWKLCGHVFDSIPSWIHETSPGTKDLWAPDISSYSGHHQLYYAYSLFGKNLSGIALATNKTLDRKDPSYRWVDQGLVLKSTGADDYNAIDPNFIADATEQRRLAFGSFRGGIKLVRLGADGKASSADKTIYSIASREKPALQISTIAWVDGWPRAALGK
jgi:arabinan endo-1,5-alpha-L-arabinosidase